MTADEALEYFKEEKVDVVEDHSIPNTPHTRRLRKKVLENLNEHMMSEMMNQQMGIRINIINEIKKELDKNSKEQQEFIKVKKVIEDNFTS